jgi:hypothetical protein
MPVKGQKVNLELYYDVIEVSKTPEEMSKKKKLGDKIAEPFKKIGFFANLFKENQISEDLDPTRYLVLYESRLLCLEELSSEQVRNYGSHFSVKDKDKLQMPRITWNAEIRSVRSLRDLACIRLLNYKEAVANNEIG